MHPYVQFALVEWPPPLAGKDFDPLGVLPMRSLTYDLEYDHPFLKSDEEVDFHYRCVGCIQVDPEGWKTSSFRQPKEGIPEDIWKQMSQHTRMHQMIGAWARKEYGLR